jgi:hypothetical protein
MSAPDVRDHPQFASPICRRDRFEISSGVEKMKEPDLSGVDPVRVPEARRRIAAIRSYMALPNPTTADAIRIGESVGLSRWRFVRLVRLWREHHDARRLVMDRRNNSGPTSLLDPVAATIVSDVIREMGADAKLATVAERIEARCAAAGVKAPVRPTIWHHMRKMRAASAAPASGPPRIVIGRMWFPLRVEGLPIDAMSMALIAVMLPERIIVAHRVSVGMETPASVTDLVGDIADRQVAEGNGRPLLIEAGDRHAAADQLYLMGLAQMRPHRRSLQIEISKAFGGRLDQLKALYRPSRASAVKKPKTRQAQPLTKAEAIHAITTAIDANNAAISATIPPFKIAACEP